MKPMIARIWGMLEDQQHRGLEAGKGRAVSTLYFLLGRSAGLCSAGVTLLFAGIGAGPLHRASVSGVLLRANCPIGNRDQHRDAMGIKFAKWSSTRHELMKINPGM